ncbi:MAG: hypothetical protein M0Z42_16140 [Actinomycetota bacterium]|nr:hypothetical protein [Actinomycetota bacterium]
MELAGDIGELLLQVALAFLEHLAATRGRVLLEAESPLVTAAAAWTTAAAAAPPP